MKRFLLYLSALFVGVSFATAQTYEISASTGTLTNGTAKSAVWTSTGLAGFTLESTCNGAAVDMMNINSGLLQLYANYNGNDITYTINAPEGYLISEYVIKYKKGSSSFGITITAENGVAQTPAKTTAEQTFEVEGLSGASTVFTLEGTTHLKDFIKITSFIVTLQEVGEGGEEPGDDSAIMEQYDAIAKPTFGTAGNTTFVKAATLAGDVNAEVTGIQAVAGQACVTNVIEVAAGAVFDLNITYQLNWGDLAIYQIENGEATKEYGYYEGSWGTGDTGLVIENIKQTGVEVEGTSTVIYPITISDNHNVGDVIVVRAITGDQGENNSAYEQGISEGGYVDFLFVVAETYTLTVGETEWATLCLDNAVRIPGGVEVYTVSEIKDGYVELGQVSDVIPARCPVLVNASWADEWDFVYTSETGEEYVNLLQGTTEDEYITEEAYVLGIVDGEVGLYKAEMRDGKWLNNANKAYLPASVASGAASYSFRFGEGTTGIENVEVENASNVIYDLTGRRVEAITAPGIYIVGGKKVLVK